MPGCPISITVRYADGKPAPYASVMVYEVVPVLWWSYDKFVAARTANFQGQVRFDLTKGKKYHFVYRSPGKKGDDIVTMDYCDRTRVVYYP